VNDSLRDAAKTARAQMSLRWDSDNVLASRTEPALEPRRRFDMNKLILLALGLMISACANPEQEAYKKRIALAPTKQDVLIESDPPGARIEVNDEYKGTAPLTISIPIRPNGSASEFTRIVALPAPGQRQQSKLFSPDRYAIGGSGWAVPKRILFVMNLGTATPAIDVNIQSSS
jgi:hypothetical protein